jgi:hypothetical protein
MGRRIGLKVSFRASTNRMFGRVDNCGAKELGGQSEGITKWTHS